MLQDKIKIKAGKNGKYLDIGPLLEIDEKWVYISELINGDGHITKNFWYITFVNQDFGLIEYIKKFFLSLGLNKKQVYVYKREDAIFLIIRSYLLAYLLNKILDVSIGKKHSINIKEFVISNKKFGIAAVRGAFDAEGSVTSTGSRRISITSNCRRWLSQLQEILIKLRIKSMIFQDNYKKEKPIYRLIIHHYQNLKKFQDIIKPLHSKRKEKLKEILNNYTKNPQKMFHKKILLSIKKGYVRKRNIAKGIQQNLILVGNNINWLRKNRFIEPYEKIYTNKGCFHRYKVTQKGERYIKKSLSFFD
tara:strand:- start:86 stop:1000 length:915 start_codon:yes stop_codon:yes gene_type:complete